MADLSALREDRKPTISLSADEKRLFTQVFQAADKERLGVVTGDVALSFFPQRTHLPVDVLGEIWQLADVEDTGFLTPNGFYVVLRLIGYAQAGKPVNAESALRAGPLPRFDGINNATPTTPVPATPLQAQGSGGPIRVPPLLVDKANQYASLFEESGAQNGLLPGATAKQIFDRAQLPNDMLVRIWNLADTEMRGMLSCTEFIIAMHLLASFRNGSMRALPQSLPAGLYEAAAKRGTPARPGSASRSTPGSPSMANTSRQVAAAPPRATSPLASQPYTAPPIASQISNSPAADGWVITSSEKEKYDSQFAKLDASGRGFVSGDEAVGFFSKSGLSENDLAQIWDLADIRSEGRLNRDEFSVAMHLIVQNVQSKAPIPSILPTNLVPPSMRDLTGLSQKSTAPDFQQPHALSAPKQAQSAAEDLFGLDAISTTNTKNAVAQVAQSTGGSSGFPTPPSPNVKSSPTMPSKPTISSSIFKPFQPSSTFGQSMVTPQITGTSSTSRNRGVVNSDDLLGEEDEGMKSVGTESIDIGNLSNQVGTLSEQTSEVKTKRNATENSLTQSITKKSELEDKLAQMRQAYEREARDVKALEEKLTGIRNDNTKLQQDLVMLQHTQQNLTEERQKISQQLAADQEENLRLKEEINKANTETNEIKPQIEKLKSEARQQKGLVAINKKQLATLETDLNRLKQEHGEAARDHATATSELKDLQSSHEALSMEHQKHLQGLDTTQRVADYQPVSNNEVGNNDPDHNDLNLSALNYSTTNQQSSTNSLNPFFKRSNSGVLGDSDAASPSLDVKSPNHSAFDDFFGPSIKTNTAAVPPPESTFGVFTKSIDHESVAAEVNDSNELVSHEAEVRSKVPPSPPRSRQTSSNNNSARHGPQESSSGDSGASKILSPREALSSQGGELRPDDRDTIYPPEHDSSPAKELREANNGEPSFTIRTSNDLPGTFPEETPLQSPSHTGPGKANDQIHALQGIGNDPFASKTMTPASARDDFESAFASLDKGKDDDRTSRKLGQAANKVDSTEFPPIEHFENDDSDSNSESDKAFIDDFVPAGTIPHPGQEQDPILVGNPPIDTMPSTLDQTQIQDASGLTEVSGMRGVGQPASERAGSLPPPKTSTFPSLGTSAETANIQATGSTVEGLGGSGGKGADVAAFDDDDFQDLSEANAVDDTNIEDFNTSVNPRRFTDDEFNPTFDSPSTSVRNGTSATLHEVDTNETKSNGFFNFESNIQASGTAGNQGTTVSGISNTPTSHDWDAMFAGLDNTQYDSSGDGFSKISKTLGTAADKPPLTRGISDGTEHDDPILKNLMGMGFSRDESLKALEKFDYNINKAADYLTSKS